MADCFAGAPDILGLDTLCGGTPDIFGLGGCSCGGGGGCRQSDIRGFTETRPLGRSQSFGATLHDLARGLALGSRCPFECSFEISLRIFYKNSRFTKQKFYKITHLQYIIPFAWPSELDVDQRFSDLQNSHIYKNG